MKIGNILAIILMSVGLASVAQASGDGAAGEKIVTGVCAACHGIDGNSVITTNPKLAQQHPEYIAKQLANFKAGERKNPVMSGMAASLSPEDMANVAAYFGSQKGKVGSAKTNAAGSLGEKIIVVVLQAWVCQLVPLAMVQLVQASLFSSHVCLGNMQIT